MRSLIIATTLLALAATATAQTSVRLADEDGNNVVRANNMQVTSTADRTVITLDMVLDSLRVPSNRYRAFTPILRSNDGSQQQRLKTLIVSGRTQDIVFEREGIDPLYADNCDNIRRMNGQPQSYAYTDAVPAQMWHKTAEVLMESDFWKNQIVQINVMPDKGIELVPRVGDHIIYLGYLPTAKNKEERFARISDFLDRKLERLEKFYRYGLSQAGWNKYSRISVEYSNQIVCKKK